ncbi:SET domain-containing protein 4 [Physocladia obscura]|uniref:SET domain-containing protein 4 n=1 Tax=Physocladia obscura TaxID=109957 RepID=A0AAD5XIA6_9FUNG|nr:SET domain-containing protein 4 [Physocladia obscura]
MNLFFLNRPITFRGLMATKLISIGSPIISVDEKFLITIDKVESFFSSRSIRVKPHLNEQTALALFLAVHRPNSSSLSHYRQALQFTTTIWTEYFNILPIDFNTVAANFSKELLELLPEHTRNVLIHKQVCAFERDFDCAKSAAEKVFTLCQDDFRWAWYAVNTRCITLDTTIKDAMVNRADLMKPRPKKLSKMALAPYLDLLNHSPDAAVTANFNHEKNAFEIIALQPIPRGVECFISYGAHDNAFLLVEYGFAVEDPQKRDGVHNPYDHVVIDKEIFSLEIPGEKEGFRERAVAELEGAGLFGNYSLYFGQESYRVINALRLYACMTHQDFKGQVNIWRQVFQGKLDIVSVQNEFLVKKLLFSICVKAAHEIRNRLVTLNEWSKKYGELSKDGAIQAYFTKLILESALSVLEWNLENVKEPEF